LRRSTPPRLGAAARVGQVLRSRSPDQEPGGLAGACSSAGAGLSAQKPLEGSRFAWSQAQKASAQIAPPLASGCTWSDWRVILSATIDESKWRQGALSRRIISVRPEGAPFQSGTEIHTQGTPF